MQSRPPPTVLRTVPFAHYSVAWSPFHPNLIALASSANFGLVGNGRLHLARASTVPPEARLDKSYDAQDGLYDVAWSEIHENQLVTASGDGSLKLWDITLNDLPIRAWHEHSREAFSVDWSNVDKQFFASSSWDGTVKIWSPERPASVRTIAAHSTCAYQALFSPHSPHHIASCSTDGTLKIFDLRAPTPAPAPGGALAPPALTVPAQGTEILSLDWNKYRPFVIACGGVDRRVTIWDCRMASSAVPNATQVGGALENELRGHEYAVRKVQWSPHRADLIASSSYDMTCRVWSTAAPPPQPALRAIHDLHTEFVVGCAWSLFEEGVLASCSWDCSVHVYRPEFM